MATEIYSPNVSFLTEFFPEALANYLAYVKLLSGATANKLTSKAGVTALEILPGTNGYDPNDLGLLFSAPTYNSSTEIATFPQAPLDISATGTTDLVFGSYAVCLNALGKTPFAPKSIASTAVNTSTNRIAWTGHPLAAGDYVMLTPQSGGTNPSSVDANVTYRVFSPTTNDFQLTIDGANPLALGSGASGNLSVRQVPKYVIGVWRSSEDVTISPGGLQSFPVTLAIAKSSRVTQD